MEIICRNPNKSLSNDKEYVLVDINRFLSTGQNPKREFQEWLDTIQFGLFITVEPTPSSPMKDDDVKQRVREIDHKINKYFIGNRYSRFKNKMDRFWLLGFFESGHRGRLTRHLHLLHYIPYDQLKIKGSKNFQRDMVKNQFQFLWSNNPYVTPLNDTRPVCPIHIETISTQKDSVSVSRYSSKEIHQKRNYDDYFFSY
jgi:hypothetical protein